MDGEQAGEHTYASAHLLYRRAGWASPLPLPAEVKFPPPDGFTGWHGLDPSGADSQAWIDDYPEYRDTRQLALRMPATVIGIDVDHYGAKRGADTMAEAMRRWGPIPIGAHSSARGDGAAGIWFYRVPKGATLRTRIAFPELGLGHIEIIQRHHRYAVVWPSVHPETGETYRWYGLSANGDGPDDVARVADLPMLPQGWLDALAGADDPGVSAADPQTVAEFAKRYATGTEPGALRGVLATWERDAATTARHDAMMSAVCMAAREARMGRYSAADARAQLRQAFTLALAEAKPGQRLAGPDVARREFDSMWAWGVSAALGEPEAELEARRERTATAASTQALARPSAQDFWTDEGELPRPPGSAPAEPGAGGGLPPGYALSSAGEQIYVGHNPGDIDEMTPEELAAHQFQLEVAARVRALRIGEAARSILDDERREPFEMLDADDFLDSPLPDYLVPRLLYRNGTAKVFGPPGGTKSFLALDLALSLATGTPWRGKSLKRELVHYVMAEGRAVNASRTHAWLHHRGVKREELRGWFRVVPRGVLLTEAGIAQYLLDVRADRPALIVLDTKARMMVGDENQAADNAVMIRALDTLREASDACVLLVDHTGVGDTTRARGGNSVEGAMDSEIRVVRDKDTDVATAEVTRDKDGSTGYQVTYRLVQIPELARPDHEPPAVPVACDAQEALALRSPDDWDQDRPFLPEDILDYRGPGDRGLRPLARFMRHRATGDVGVTRLEARKAVQTLHRDLKDDTIHRAWSALLEKNRLKLENKRNPTGRSFWVERDDDPTL